LEAALASAVAVAAACKLNAGCFFKVVEHIFLFLNAEVV
jgi:hypothetical protein